MRALESRTGRGKKRRLLRRRFAPENRVAMGKAPEEADDFRVPLGPGERLDEAGLIVQAAEQRYGALLRARRLRVHVGHVHEPALDGNEIAIVAARDRFLR